jgi:phosphatidylinositol alpha-1,6-mannosyltransferase
LKSLPPINLVRQLLISEIFPPRTGGSGRWFAEIYRRLPREQYFVAPGECAADTHVIDQHPAIIGRLPLSLPEWGIRSWQGLRGYWRAWRATAKLVRANRIDRLHCGRMLPEGWIAWLLNHSHGIPYVCYVHGEETSYGIHSRELGWMMRRVLRGSDLLVANSQNTAAILRREWSVPEAKLQVLHPGVDTDLFQPAERNADLRRQLGWGERPVVLTVGRLQKRKGHDILLQALPEIIRRVPELLYVIVGEGEERPRLERLIAELQLECHVQMLGELQDQPLVEAYQQCDLFVLPNRDVAGDIEGFGMVLLEAQACGRAVIAGDSGGTAETMQPNISGLILDCTQPKTLEHSIPELLLDTECRRAMGRAGRTWTEAHFAWPALAQAAALLLDPQSQADLHDPLHNPPNTSSSSDDKNHQTLDRRTSAEPAAHSK